MRVLLQTDNTLMAINLKDEVVNAVRGLDSFRLIDNWSYSRSSDGYDIIYHNPSQYVGFPEKNVLFRVEFDGSMVVLSPAWWRKNPEPSSDMICLHIGRLTEMLLKYFKTNFIKFIIAD